MIGKPFEVGRVKSGGRAKGTRNLISEAFLTDLLAEWKESGAAALKVMAKTDQSNFVKVTAALLPKELDISDSRLSEMSDSELDEAIEYIKRQIAERAVAIREREDSPTLN